MNSFLNSIATILHSIPFSGATWFTILTLIFFVWLFAKANKDPTNAVKWEHLILDSENERASPYKLGYLVGVIISTWIVIRMTDSDKLTFDIFGMYLAFLVGGVGIQRFTKAKDTDYKNDE